MGSAFLPVNQECERYIDRAESTYRELNEKIKSRLVDLTMQAKEMAEGEKWRGDPWLEQMDWTPRKAGAGRGIVIDVCIDSSRTLNWQNC
jgi:DNA polymerase gamma 1